MSQAHRIERLLFLDDSEDEVFITRLLLEKQRVGLELQAFATEAELEASLAASAPESLFRSLLAIDMNLTLTTGSDVMDRLRRGGAGFMLAGICSGSEDPEDRRIAELAGADFYVGKPLNAARLEEIATAVPGLATERTEDGTLTLWWTPAERQRGSAGY